MAFHPNLQHEGIQFPRIGSGVSCGRATAREPLLDANSRICVGGLCRSEGVGCLDSFCGILIYIFHERLLIAVK